MAIDSLLTHCSRHGDNHLGHFVCLHVNYHRGCSAHNSLQHCFAACRDHRADNNVSHAPTDMTERYSPIPCRLTAAPSTVVSTQTIEGPEETVCCAPADPE